MLGDGLQMVWDHREICIAFLVAGLLTLFDLDTTFYIPRAVGPRVHLAIWWWGFVVVNGLLAACLYLLLKDHEPLKDTNPWAGAAYVGFGYLALVRLKLTTIRDVHIGPEAFYERLKEYVYRRINGIAREAREAETTQLVQQLDLAALVERAKLRIHNDALLSDEQKRKALAWMLQVVQDNQSQDFDKKVLIAIFFVTGATSSQK
jgi:hypothetical protein